MIEKTKKRLLTAGLSVLCIGLAAGIGWNLSKGEGETETPVLAVEKETENQPLVVQAETKPEDFKTEEKPEEVQAEETKDKTEEETQTDVVVSIQTETKENKTDDQVIQETPVKTENEKPSEPPTVKKDTEKTNPAKIPEYKDETTTAKKEPATTTKPKHGDVKDGMMYVEGFGWIKDEGTGEGTYAPEIYENGNKVGSMD